MKMVAFNVHVVILLLMQISFNGYATCFFHLWGFPWLLSSHSQSQPSDAIKEKKTCLLVALAFK